MEHWGYIELDVEFREPELMSGQISWDVTMVSLPWPSIQMVNEDAIVASGSERPNQPIAKINNKRRGGEGNDETYGM
jgi:hypothetical protein